MTIEPPVEIVVAGVIGVGIACGFVWGRLSTYLVMPELLRMLLTPIWTGVLGVVVAFPLSLVFFGSRIRNSPHDGVIFATLVSCFGAGLLLGLPGILGWTFGYRQPTKRPSKSR
jgi:hypothetical protein